MCRTCGRRHNSIDDENPTDTSPGSLQDGGMGSNGFSIPFMVRSPGKTSPMRGRTMKDYEEQLTHLKKENFSLKLRIYFLEQEKDQKYDKDDKDNIHHTNIELKVENEALKKELYDKQELLRQASSVLTGLDQQHQEQMEQIKNEYDQNNKYLEDKVQQLQKEIDQYTTNFSEENKIGELTQLCSLAFRTNEPDGTETNKLTDTVDSGIQSMPSATKVDQSNPSVRQALVINSPVSGLSPFSIPNTSNPANNSDKSQHAMNEEITIAKEKEKQLVTQITSLQTKINELQETLVRKEQIGEALKADIENLKRELEDKEEKIIDLEAEVTDKDQRVDQLMQELETRHTEIAEREDKIQTLHQEICRVEPQIEVKVQEIVERDRIIEEKIEQIEQQNKILVEIQITLDEKQKQIAELEDKLQEYQDKNRKLVEESHEKSLQLQVNVKEIESRDKDLAVTKREVKRLEKKCRDLVAENNESLDMVKKLLWEAETKGGDDGVKEMVEEENERLWAELEQRKTEVLALKAEHETALQEARKQIALLQETVDVATQDSRNLQRKCEKHEAEINEQNNRLRDKNEEVNQLEKELASLRGDVNSREGLLRSNEGIVEGLKNELKEVKEQLLSKKIELADLQDELKKKNNDMQDLVNKELWERNKEVEKLQNKLSLLNINHKEEIEALRNQLIPSSQSNNKCINEEFIPNANQYFGNSNTSNGKQPNIVNLTQINNTCGNIQALGFPPHEPGSNINGADPTVVGDPTVIFLYEEMGKIRNEAQALRQERLVLNEKLNGLQKLHEDFCQSNANPETSEIQLQIEGLKKQLEETKEEKQQKEKQHDKVVNNFQGQIEILKSELNNAKRKIAHQISEVSVRKYKESLRFYKTEVASLRKRLAESNNTCETFKTRLEDLTALFERILKMEKDGLIDLSNLSSCNMTSLQHSLNESRILCDSLSQSMMEYALNESKFPEEFPSSISSMASSTGIHRDDSLTGIPDHFLLEPNSSIKPSIDDTQDQICEDDISPDAEYQQLAAKLTSEIDQKEKEINNIAERVSNLSDELHSKVLEVREQASEIVALQGEVGALKDQIKEKDQVIEMLNSQSNIDSDRNDASCTLSKSNNDSLKSLSCSDNLPNPEELINIGKISARIPAIIQTEQELETGFQQSDNSSLSAVKSAYSTDMAIRASSNNPDYFDKLVIPNNRLLIESTSKLENVTANGGLEAAPARSLLSPSESEAWSEPDRDVSLARIGLDTSTLGTSIDRSPSRTRQPRSSVLASESDCDPIVDEGASNSMIKNSKRRSDAEVRRLYAKLRNLEQLNDTLKAELDIYQAISKQIPFTTEQGHLVKRHSANDKALETFREDNAIACVDNINLCPVLPLPLLEEIKALRVKLEEAIANNDQLRDQLEAAIAIHPGDDGHIHQLAINLQHTTDQLQCAQEKLTIAYKSEQSMCSQYNSLHQKFEEKLQQYEELKARFENVKGEMVQLQSNIQELNREVKGKDMELKEKIEKLTLAQEYQNECEAKLSDQDKAITNLCDNLKKLQKNISSEVLESQNKHLQETLKSTEEKLLHVTKERLTLIGEKTKLHAQLASMATEAQLSKERHDSESESDEINILKLKLKKSLSTIMNLEREKQELVFEKHTNDKEREILKEENASLRGKTEHMLLRESHLMQDQIKDTKDTAALRNSLSQLHKQCSYQQEIRSALESEIESYKENVTRLKEEISELNSMLCRYKETDTKIHQLNAQLESEKQLTSNLKLQLDTLQSTRHSTASNLDALQDPSDLASPDSATSFEFICPSAPIYRPNRPTSLGSLQERNRRKKEYWNNKENLLKSTSLVQSENNLYRTRKQPSLPNDINFALEELDMATTTSGESPDLGIGSDGHFSSLERASKSLRTLVPQPQLSNVRDVTLCSEPSHSSLKVDNDKLRKERKELNNQLKMTKESLQEALDRLTKSNQRRENIEKAIHKQLIKTRDVLNTDKVNKRRPEKMRPNKS